MIWQQNEKLISQPCQQLIVVLQAQTVENKRFSDRHFWHAGYDKASLDTSENQGMDIKGTHDNKGNISINPFLLNPREKVNIIITFVNDKPNFVVNARIVGGSAVSQDEFENKPVNRMIRYLTESFPIFVTAIIGVLSSIFAASILEFYTYVSKLLPGD